ncbi:hypothetical protein ACFZAR_31825 [Streptomyces sp. NPDC008222]|uniref:hypothetical protein n=1 Tax=Streptomyces sp. NPDC008222 TaxID=3364820 RepID=UPI0036F02556
MPAVALGVAFVWLGERPQPVELVGGLLTLAGVALVGRPTRARRDTGVTAADGGGAAPAQEEPPRQDGSAPTVRA